MSETKHTPGPWSVWTPRGPDYRDIRCYILGPAPADERELAPTVAEVTMSKNSEANARLLAAAPELLAELRHIVSMINSEGKALPDPLSCAAEMAREAIRKATGGDDA